VYLVYVEHMARRLLAATARGSSSLVVLALAATGAVLIATNGWPAVSAFPHPNGMIGWPRNEPLSHRGQNGVRATFLRGNGVLHWEFVCNDSFEDEDAAQALGHHP
jgi:hypothetical protein